MNMIRIPQLLIGLLILCAACTSKEKETPAGLKYTVLKSGDGVLPKTDEVVVFNYVMKDSKDSIWRSTYELGMPQFVPIRDSVARQSEDKLTQLFYYLSKGDSVKVSFPIKEFFRDFMRAPVPEKLDTAMSIQYVFNIVDMKGKDSINAYHQRLLEKKTASQAKKDEKLIVEYLAKNNVTAVRDSSGLYYALHNNANGEKPTVESCVEVKYKGTFLKDGNTFDANPKIAFPLGNVIRGWQIGIPKLGVGDSATLYIPSGLAYGPEGRGMPPDAILVFDVTLLGVGNDFDPKTRTCIINKK